MYGAVQRVQEWMLGDLCPVSRSLLVLSFDPWASHFPVPGLSFHIGNGLLSHLCQPSAFKGPFSVPKFHQKKPGWSPWKNTPPYQHHLLQLYPCAILRWLCLILALELGKPRMLSLWSLEHITFKFYRKGIMFSEISWDYLANFQLCAFKGASALSTLWELCGLCDGEPPDCPGSSSAMWL